MQVGGLRCCRLLSVVKLRKTKSEKGFLNEDVYLLLQKDVMILLQRECTEQNGVVDQKTIYSLFL